MKIEINTQEKPHRLAAICSSGAILTGGLGVRFEVTDGNDTFPAFVVRYPSGISAYINRCAHLALELDWEKGLFFDVDERHIICSTHGALYSVDTGECIDGPCNGSGLKTLQIAEVEGTVYLKDSRYVISRVEVESATDQHLR